MSAKNYLREHFTQDIQNKEKNSSTKNLNKAGFLTTKLRKVVVTLGIKLSTSSLPDKLPRYAQVKNLINPTPPSAAMLRHFGD